MRLFVLGNYFQFWARQYSAFWAPSVFCAVGLVSVLRFGLRQYFDFWAPPVFCAFGLRHYFVTLGFGPATICDKVGLGQLHFI